MTAKAMDPRLEDSIWRAIEGEDSSWPTHKKFRGGKDFEKMFKAGDQQALLWAIYDRAKKRNGCPPRPFSPASLPLMKPHGGTCAGNP
jgi:hypothetical protein